MTRIGESRIPTEQPSLESRFAEYLNFAKNHKLVAFILLLWIVVPTCWSIYATIEQLNIGELEQKVSDRDLIIQNKNTEIQRLETQLTPFRTIALEKYTGSEQEALRKLTNDLEELKSHLDPFKKPIASASANVEITIKSEEQVNATYMTCGGLLAFVKNQQSLLFVSDTKSTARQNGKGEVVYKGDFQIQTDRSAIGKPVEILQDSDLIQIKFKEIPENSGVLKGNASVVINGDLRLDFEIMPQQMQGKSIIIRDIKNKFIGEN